MNKRETEILYKKIQKQKMKILFADVLVKIVEQGEVKPEAINNIFEEEYKKHF